MSDQPTQQSGLKYKLAQRVIFTTFAGDRFPGRVVDASRDHVTVILYGGPNRGRTFRVEGDDVARCIARDTRRRR